MLSLNQPSTPHRRQNSTPMANNVSSDFPFLPVTPTHSAESHRRGSSLKQHNYSHKPQNHHQKGNGMPITNQQGQPRQPVMQEAQLQLFSRPGQYSQSASNFNAFNPSYFDVFAPTSFDQSAAYDIDNGQSFENLNISAMQSSQYEIPSRPQTPINQTTTVYFPMTPSTTSNGQKSGKRRNSQTRKETEGYQGQQQMMITPFITPMKRGSSYQDVFSNTGYFADNPQLPSPPNTVPLKSSKRFDATPVPAPDFYNMSAFGIDFSINNNTYDSSNYSPMTNQASSGMTSYNTSPLVEPMDLFGDLDNTPSTNGNNKTSPEMIFFDSSPITEQTDLFGDFGSIVPINGSNNTSPELSSFDPSPVAEQADPFSDYDNILLANARNKTQERQLQNSQNAEVPIGIDLPREPERSRSRSIPNMNLNILFPSKIIETGITQEEIASFIAAIEDNKWACLFPGCVKQFKRKENIKAHVQTHLDDRQFQCGFCQKTFVRQHDLKRHATTHSDEKIYKCECNSEFNRADALTRHRQRGICKGTIQGTPRKSTKRGRPKKVHRPDTEERLAKAAKTRQRVLEKQLSASPCVEATTSASSPEVGTLMETCNPEDVFGSGLFSDNWSPPEDDDLGDWLD